MILFLIYLIELDTSFHRSGYQNLPTVVLSVCIPPPLEVCYQLSQIHNPSGGLICPLRKQTQSEG